MGKKSTTGIGIRLTADTRDKSLFTCVCARACGNAWVCMLVNARVLERANVCSTYAFLLNLCGILMSQIYIYLYCIVAKVLSY